MNEKTIPFRKVLVVGGGMIGSSILRAARTRWGDRVTLWVLDRDEVVRNYCQKHHLADRVLDYLEQWDEGVDLVLLAVPLGSYEDCLRALEGLLSRGGGVGNSVVVSDVGSSKRSVCRVFASGLPSGCYGIPGHPVAGVEKSGPWSGRADLFENRHCVLTPYAVFEDAATQKKAENAMVQLTLFWQKLGMRVEEMTAEHHDLVLAMTSHLPTLIAYCLAGTAKGMESLDWHNQFFLDGRHVQDNWGSIDTLEVMRYAAGGFRDFTRIAASDPTMWRDVYLNNKSPVLYVLDLFSQDLDALRQAIQNGDGEFLQRRFERSQKIRQGIVEMGQAGSFEPTEQTGKEVLPKEADQEKTGNKSAT